MSQEKRIAVRVSTHSRPKAAGRLVLPVPILPVFQLTAARRRLALIMVSPLHWLVVSTHSRPKAAGDSSGATTVTVTVSTHSRPKAAGLAAMSYHQLLEVSTHSRPKAAGPSEVIWGTTKLFQLTAARRRLVEVISTVITTAMGFNSQPPEGGWCLR